MTDVKDLDRVLRINEEQKLKNSVLEKELKIRNARANSQIEKMAELEELKDFEIEETDYAIQTQNMRAAIVARENAITFPYPEMDTHIRLGPGSLAMFFASTGSGKCFAKDTEILMFNGTIKRVQDIKIGDLLMGPDSKPRTVLSLANGQEEMFRVSPVKGDPYVVNKSHILSLVVSTKTKIYKEYNHGDIVNISVDQYLKASKCFKHNTKGYRAAVDFEARNVPVDPYLIGYWLGDGDSKDPRFVSADHEVFDRVQKSIDLMNENSSEILKMRQVDKAGTAITVGITGSSRKEGSNAFLNALRELDLISNKHVPELYKINSREVRLSILAGLVDSDGSLANNCIDFCFKSKKLADGVVFLARSLGFAAYIKEVQKMCCNSKTRAIGTYHRISISGDLSSIPTVIARKQATKRTQVKNVLHTGIAVESIGDGEYYGFGVDGDHLFLLSDFTVCHNSTYVANAAYYLAFRENKKILIIVNEESIIDVGARISCLHRGHSIHKFRRGTQAYPQSILDEISDLNFLKEKITILDASKHEARVRSFEGVMQAIEKAKFTYDAIFIDYYQNIDRSLADPLMNSFEAQARFASRVDIAKNNAKCPIILMGQIRKTDDDFEQRIKGRKIIVDKCTDVFELVVEKEKSRTTMKIHKDRWGGKQGEEVYLGYEDGFLKFYNDDFEERALERQRQHIDAKFSNSATVNEEDEDD